MRAIKISLRTAQLIHSVLRLSEGQAIQSAAAELAAAMKPKPVKKFVRAAKARKATKKATKKTETAAIREALFERSRGHCEMCGDEGSDMHHALSRRVPQDISNVLFLCRQCHRDITNNRPSAVDALQAQASKFGELGLARTAHALLRRRDFVLARGAA